VNAGAGEQRGGVNVELVAPDAEPALGRQASAGVVSEHLFKVREDDLLEVGLWPVMEQLAERGPPLVAREGMSGAAKLAEAFLEISVGVGHEVSL
jgi:hypothetical protein